MHKQNYYTAIKVAVVVGTILNLINNYHPVVKGLWSNALLLKISLTYCVPFIVSSYSSWKALNNKIKNS